MLTIGLVFETVLACFLQYTPGLNAGLGLEPTNASWWLCGVPYTLLIFGYDEMRKYFIRKFPGGMSFNFFLFNFLRSLENPKIQFIQICLGFWEKGITNLVRPLI